MQDKKENHLDLKQIKQIINLVEDSNLSEFEIEKDSFRLRLCKGSLPAISPTPTTKAQAPEQPPTPQKDDTTTVEDIEAEGNFKFIKAPMVGTFYRSPSPEADSYVEDGDKVTDKTVVCIVEAMKVMNEIPAECKGTVVEILAENGKGVEYGQPLLKIALS
tara:strand:- start:15 stop:497 length:483 start_codon:yes stop_codon:yes gene_type:complete